MVWTGGDYSTPIDLNSVVQKRIEVPCIAGDRDIILRSLENESRGINITVIYFEYFGY